VYNIFVHLFLLYHAFFSISNYWYTKGLHGVKNDTTVTCRQGRGEQVYIKACLDTLFCVTQ